MDDIRKMEAETQRELEEVSCMDQKQTLLTDDLIPDVSKVHPVEFYF